MPKKTKPDTELVKDYIMRYGAISKHMAYSHFGTMSLPQIIEKLRKRGLKIAYSPQRKKYVYTKES